MNMIIRKTILILILPFAIMAQDDGLYPVESFYGGGVGFSQMYLFLDIGKLDGFEFLGSVLDTVSGTTKGLGLNTDNFRFPFVINGGEGFSSITGRWRLGGYAGVGSSLIADRPQIFLFIDKNGDGEFTEGDETAVEYTGSNAPDIQAEFSMWIGGATIEYVFPIFRGLEISPGVLMGAGRANLSITQGSGKPYWESIFSGVYDLGIDGYVAVGDLTGDDITTAADIALAQTDMLFSSSPSAVAMTSLTGAFFIIQPYVAIKLQFLDRVGLRLSVGFNLGKVNQGKWVLNNQNTISDSPATSLNSLAVRAMIYFGL